MNIETKLVLLTTRWWYTHHWTPEKVPVTIRWKDRKQSSLLASCHKQYSSSPGGVSLRRHCVLLNLCFSYVNWHSKWSKWSKFTQIFTLEGGLKILFVCKQNSKIHQVKRKKCFQKTPQVRLGVADIWTFAQILLWRASDYLAFVWFRQQNHVEEARGRVNGVWEAPHPATPLIYKHWTGDPGTRRAVTDQKTLQAVSIPQA